LAYRIQLQKDEIKTCLLTTTKEKKYLNKKLRNKRARRHGLVVGVKINVQEVVGSNPGPAVETIYLAPLIGIKSM
jgi:hypothetical protein